MEVLHSQVVSHSVGQSDNTLRLSTSRGRGFEVVTTVTICSEAVATVTDWTNIYVEVDMLNVRSDYLYDTQTDDEANTGAGSTVELFERPETLMSVPPSFRDPRQHFSTVQELHRTRATLEP